MLDSDEPTYMQLSYLLPLLPCMHIATLHTFQKVVGRSVCGLHIVNDIGVHYIVQSNRVDQKIVELYNDCSSS